MPSWHCHNQPCLVLTNFVLARSVQIRHEWFNEIVRGLESIDDPNARNGFIKFFWSKSIASEAVREVQAAVMKPLQYIRLALLLEQHIAYALGDGKKFEYILPDIEARVNQVVGLLVVKKHQILQLSSAPEAAVTAAVQSFEGFRKCLAPPQQRIPSVVTIKEEMNGDAFLQLEDEPTSPRAS